MYIMIWLVNIYLSFYPFTLKRKFSNIKTYLCQGRTQWCCGLFFRNSFKKSLCRNVPGLSGKFCNGPGTKLVCSPYKLFIFCYCKADEKYLFIFFIYLNCIIFTVNIFRLEENSVDWIYSHITVSFLNHIMFTINTLLCIFVIWRQVGHWT